MKIRVYRVETQARGWDALSENLRSCTVTELVQTFITLVNSMGRGNRILFHGKDLGTTLTHPNSVQTVPHFLCQHISQSRIGFQEPNASQFSNECIPFFPYSFWVLSREWLLEQG